MLKAERLTYSGITHDFRSAGKGQKGVHGKRARQESSRFHLFLHEHLEADKAFFISIVASLAITDALLPFTRILR
jgi:hypothetical protein